MTAALFDRLIEKSFLSYSLSTTRLPTLCAMSAEEVLLAYWKEYVALTQPRCIKVVLSYN